MHFQFMRFPAYDLDIAPTANGRESVYIYMYISCPPLAVACLSLMLALLISQRGLCSYCGFLWCWSSASLRLEMHSPYWACSATPAVLNICPCLDFCQVCLTLTWNFYKSSALTALLVLQVPTQIPLTQGSIPPSSTPVGEPAIVSWLLIFYFYVFFSIQSFLFVQLLD